MTSTYYSSLSGMLAASHGLQNSSNNISNMQSNGFKRSDLFYTSLGNGTGEEGFGQGVQVGSKSINYSEGNYLSASSSSNLAIKGQGFFVIKLKNNELLYTRNGNFEFQNGVLIDKQTKGQVQGYDSSGHLISIAEKGPKISAGKASRDVFINGSFVPHKKDKNKSSDKDVPDPTPPDPTPKNPNEEKRTYEPVVFTLDKIYNEQGKSHSLRLEFEQNVDGFADKLWDLKSITCDDAEIEPLGNQQIQFTGDGSGAEEEKNSIHCLINGRQQININFGTYHEGKDSSVLYYEPDSQNSITEIQIIKNDGYGVGKQYNYSFDEDGQIVYHYDNGQTINGIHVGLARFDDMEHNLIQTQDNFFRAKTNKGIHFGRANKQGFACILPGQLESSNVDSTFEFANIVVLQRMFQACSQIMDIDKQLLEELESKS